MSPPATPADPQADASPSWTLGLRPLRLRYVLFLLLLVPGIVPLLISSFYLIDTNRDILKTQQKALLIYSAQSFAQLLSDELARHKEELDQLGQGLVAAPGFGTLEERLRAAWALAYLQRFAARSPEVLALRVLDQRGVGPGLDAAAVGEAGVAALGEGFSEALESGEGVYRFAALLPGRPAVAITVPVEVPESDERLIVQAVVRLPVESTALDLSDTFLVDSSGELLWSAGGDPRVEEALLRSDVVSGFGQSPISVSTEPVLDLDGEKVSIVARVVPVEETGWGLVAHKSTDVAFQEVEAMVKGTLLASLLAVLLALVFAVVATNWFSRPIHRLADASHEIAAGHFDRRVPTAGAISEVAELANDFNRMSEYVENYIEQLKRAAEANRQLFISTIRAFAAAIDAKDPYTRGHSERVARYSRAIAHYLGLPKEVQEKVWIAAVLHDIGKIGIEDRVLRKGGVLTAEEYDQMKLHPVIGADIVEPISSLREMLPGIRWHHEAWNGSGYPDGLKGEQIPLMARVIGVADTFDAITTNRPYQNASPPERALEIIRKLTGKKFDAKIVTAFLLAWEAGQIQMGPGTGAQTSRVQQAPPSTQAIAG